MAIGANGPLRDPGRSGCSALGVLVWRCAAPSTMPLAALIAAVAAGKDLVDAACTKKAVAELTRD